jgi:diguanylate cyclase (GGDEF)-like protein
MKREPVRYRDVLSRLQTLPDLGDAERRLIAHTLHGGDRADEARVAREVLERLAETGVLRRDVQKDSSGRTRLVFTTPDGFQSYSLPTAPPLSLTSDKLLSYPRPLTLDIASFRPETIRALLDLQGGIITPNSRLLAGPTEAITHCLISVRQMLEVEHASFRIARHSDRTTMELVLALPAVPFAVPEEDTTVVRENRLLYAPDLASIPGGAASGYCSAAFARAGSPSSPFTGVIAAWSRERAHFTRARLALLDLIADIASDLIGKTESLAQMVFVDPLTQVYNRTYFHLQIQKEIARAKRERTSMVLCILDLDEFKRLNEYPYGYEGANQVLRQVADILRRQVRPFDCVARWGGEEYVLLLAAPMTQPDAMAICERLRHVVEAMPFTVNGLDTQTHTVHSTLSIGAAVYPQDGTTPDELFRHANAALLQAKRPPKNAVVFWSTLDAGPPRSSGLGEGGISTDAPQSPSDLEPPSSGPVMMPPPSPRTPPGGEDRGPRT